MAGTPRHQVVARYFPRYADGTKQQHKFVTGRTRAELVAAAKAGLPSGKLYLACIWATSEGPMIWAAEVWYPEADEYVPR